VIRVGTLIAAFIAGVAAALLLIYVALRFAPDTIMADDMVDALTVVADAPLSKFPPGSAVYIKTDIGPVLLDKLQRKYPSLRILSYSLRPEDSGCALSQTAVPTRPCERNDFLKLEALTSQTRRTMLVAFGTSNTFGQVLLLKFWGHWRVLVVNRYYVV
jgi:hypothetical protein